MRIAVLGTGAVGQTLARKLVTLGHQVVMGSREAGNEAAAAFVSEAGPSARSGTFADAAGHGDLVIVATNGAATLNALKMAGHDNLAGKIVLDVTNPLDFSNGFPPSLIPELSNTTSLAETIQAAFANARVVKSLNTVNAGLMVNPRKLADPGDIFVSGNDERAKQTVIELLESFGWDHPVDLGDIATARATESYLLFWVRNMGRLGTADFNIRIVS